MFGIGMPEMLLILAIALIVIGPKKLPDLAKSLGRAMGEFKKATSDIKQSLGADADFKDVKETIDDIQNDVKKTITFDNIDEYQPDQKASADRAGTLSSDHQKSDAADTQAAMGDLKQAFDEMSQKEADPPNPPSSEADASDTGPDVTKEESPSDERG